jgi:flagellar biosynthesis protein FliR
VVDLTPILEHAAPWSLVFARILGLFLFAPVLLASAVPAPFKGLLAAMFATAAYAIVPPSFRAAPLGFDLPTYAPLLFTEILIGVSIGLLLQLPFMAIEVFGQLVGFQMGLSIAQSFNPSLGSDINSVGSLAFYMGLYAFVMLGGVDAIMLALLKTFEGVPAGGFALSQAPLELFVAVLDAAIDVAISVAAPVLGGSVVLMLALGFVMKTMPQLNIMGEGFALKIVAGFVLLVFSIFAIDRAISGHAVAALSEVVAWAESLEGAARGR